MGERNGTLSGAGGQKTIGAECLSGSCALSADCMRVHKIY